MNSKRSYLSAATTGFSLLATLALLQGAEGCSSGGGGATKPDGGRPAARSDGGAGKHDAGRPEGGSQDAGHDAGRTVDGGRPDASPPANRAPVATTQTIHTNEDEAVGITLVATDPDTNAVSYRVVDAPSHGSLSGTIPDFTYTPAPDFNGNDSFSFVANDGMIDSQPAIVSIVVAPVNDAPRVTNGTIEVDEGGTATALADAATSVLANDSDPEGDHLSVTTTPVAGVSHGMLTLHADGSFSYVHDGSETTSDNFSYEVCDNGTPSECATAMVDITIKPINDAPLAVDDGIVVSRSDTATVLTGGATSVLANDSDAEGDALSVITAPVSAPTHGTLTLHDDGTFSYAQDGTNATSDSFSYQVCDAGTPSKCATATVAITITPLNRAPVAVDDRLGVARGGTATLLAGGIASVLFNDSDADGNVLTVSTTPVIAPSHGTLVLAANGTFSYVHDGGTFGSDTFSYRVCDDATPSKCATAMVAVTISASNHPPSLVADTLTVLEGATATRLSGGATSLLANDSDPDGDLLTLGTTAVAGPSHGTLTLHANGTFNYAHDGGETTTDAFTYAACDDGAPSLCASAIVTITVTPVNDAPVAGADQYSTVGNTLLTVGSSDKKILANDSDVEGNLFMITSFDAVSAEGGTVTLNLADGTFSYLPPAGFQGTDSFTYTVTDNGTPPAAGVGIVDISVSDMVWYVDNSGTNGTGRSTQPFKDLASAQSAAGEGDTIFVATGSMPYDGGIVLKNNQQLLGKGVGLAVLPNAMIAAGSAPTITNTAGNAVTLASANLIRGIAIASPSANAIVGSGIFGAAAISDLSITGAGGAAISITNITNGGTLALSNAGAITGKSGIVLQGLSGASVTDSAISISATGGPALDISNVGTLMLTVDSLASSNSTGAGVRLDTLGGSVLVKSGITVTNPRGDGLAVSNATTGATFSFGPSNVRSAGQTAGDGYAFSNNPGATITLAMSADPQTAHGRGLFASNSGMLVISSVPSSISATGGAAIDLRNTLGDLGGSGHWHFSSLTSVASTGPGVKLQGLISAVEIVGTTGIINATGEGIRIDAVSGTLFFGNVSVSSRKNAGLFIDGATGTSASFGTLTIPNTSSATQTAVQIQNSSSAVAVTAANIDAATTAIALISDTGSFTLNTPGGSPGRGGTISNSTGNAVVLDHVSNVTLDNPIINNSGGLGISGTSVNGFTFRNGRVEKAGNAATEHAIGLVDVTGTVLVKDSVLTGMADTGLDIQNSSGSAAVTADNLDISNNDASTFCAGGPCGGSGLRAHSAGTLSLKIVDGCSFDHIDGSGIELASIGSSADLVATIQNASVSNAGNEGIWVEAGATSGTGGRLDVTIMANMTMGTGADGVRVRSSAGSMLCAQVSGNTVGTQGASAQAYDLIQSDTASFALEGTAANAGTEVSSSNTGTPVLTSGTISIAAAGTCRTPS